MVFVRKKGHFNAAHRLHNPEKSDEWNRSTYGECNHPNWHGHNYIIEVTVAGEPSSETGYIIDLNSLSEIIHTEIVEKCDHKNLNLDVGFLANIIPSTENLAKVFYEQLEKPVNEASSNSCFLYAVHLQETERNAAEYCPHILKNKI